MTAPQLPEALLHKFAVDRSYPVADDECMAMAAELLAARETIEELRLSRDGWQALAGQNASERDAARAEVERLKKQRDELIRAKTGNNPDDLLCCNGMECGCQGVTVREYELHFADRAIEAAEQPKPAGGA